MARTEEYIQTLIALGLTGSQAITWLTLSQMGQANITTIAKTVKRDRADTSRAIKSLQKLGLVDKIVTCPPKFKAVSIKEGVSMLLECKAQEYKNFIKRAKIFAEETGSNGQNKPQQVPSLIVLSRKQRINKFLQKITAQAKKSIDLCGDWQGFWFMISDNVESLKKMREKRVQFRVVINKPDNEKALSEIEQFLEKNPNSTLRYVDSSEPPLIIWMVDDNEVVLLTVPPKDFKIEGDYPCIICSNAIPLIQLGQNYFEQIWSTAKTINQTDYS